MDGVFWAVTLTTFLCLRKVARLGRWAVPGVPKKHLRQQIGNESPRGDFRVRDRRLPLTTAHVAG